MGKYISIQNVVFSIFDSVGWIGEGISTYPSNYSSAGATENYIRATILANGVNGNVNSVSGILNIDIFTLVGKGPNSTHEIADTLDKHFAGKMVTVSGGSVQFSSSALSEFGRDQDNPALHRSIYTIPFKLFGDFN